MKRFEIFSNAKNKDARLRVLIQARNLFNPLDFRIKSPHLFARHNSQREFLFVLVVLAVSVSMLEFLRGGGPHPAHRDLEMQGFTG